jgi:DNA invertase Pin-like site-specific DNA recombinase
MTQRRPAPPASPRIAVAYLRVSTDEQHLGPDAQRAAITAWATREGVSVVAWHVDAGVSGAAAIADRPELLAALAALREHGAGVLAVAKRDRLARDVMAAAMIDRMVVDAGARVVSAAGEGTDSDDPSSMLMRRMCDAFAEYERALIAARTRAALAVKRSRGEATSHAPFGFRAVDGVLVADEAEQAVIAQVRVARARGMTVRAICDELRAAGIVSRKGKPLAVSAVGELVVAHA